MTTVSDYCSSYCQVDFNERSAMMRTKYWQHFRCCENRVKIRCDNTRDKMVLYSMERHFECLDVSSTVTGKFFDSPTFRKPSRGKVQSKITPICKKSVWKKIQLGKRNANEHVYSNWSICTWHEGLCCTSRTFFPTLLVDFNRYYWCHVLSSLKQ